MRQFAWRAVPHISSTFPEWATWGGVGWFPSTSRVLSHGFLLLSILAVGIYLGTWGRALPAVSSNAASSPTAYSILREGYSLRPMSTLYAPPPQQTPARPPAAATQGAPRVEPGQGASAGEAWEERREMISYEVSTGDTVSTIAERFGISTETVLWANNIRNPDLIGLGQKLLILPVTGILHIVQRGDSLLSLAARYGVDAEAILAYQPNNIADPDSLAIDQKLFIPGGRMPSSRPEPSSRGGLRQQAGPTSAPAQAVAAAAGRFAWPTYGPIFQYFSAGHTGLDISPPYGTPVRAADSGVVVRQQKLGWDLGWNLAIDHGNGYSTVYAHLSQFDVDLGEQVSQGQLVGRVGTTGKVTGPHLHFEVHRNGIPINPLSALP